MSSSRIRRNLGIAAWVGFCAIPVLAAAPAKDSAAVAPQTAPPAARTLDLKIGEIDTRTLPNLLADSGTVFDADGHYVIQLDGPFTPERGFELERAGVTLGQYLPNFAYVAKLNVTDASAVSALGFVQWVGDFQRDWKLDPAFGSRVLTTDERKEIAARGMAQVVISLFEGEDLQPALADLATLGARVLDSNLSGRSWLIDAVIAPQDAIAVALFPAVQFIEDAPEGTLRNDSNRWIVQSNVSPQTPVWDHGIHGENQLGGLIDGTIRESHCMFDDSVPVGPTHRKIVAMRNAGGIDSHGTHTAGTFAGDAAPFNTYTTNDGMAYAAKLSFSNVDNIFAVPSTLQPRLEDAHADGARVHSNSWGDDGTTAYTTWSRQIDDFSRANEDSLVLFAVSNGNIVTTPENAKNCVGVAASNDTPSQASLCSGGTGPTADGRRKPEVFAPGCNTTSANAATTCSVTNFTGTSMACPAVSGAGLLARQYFTDGFYPTGAAVPANAFIPTGALIKAALINSSVDMTGIAGYPSNQEGWGRVLLHNALCFTGDARKLYVVDVRNAVGLSTGQQSGYGITVNSNAVPLRITLVWTEPAAAVNAANPVINNLDLEVNDGANLYRGNVFSSGQSATGGAADAKNNVEQVIRTVPAAGNYVITVKGTAVNMPLQGYALLATGDISSCGFPIITGHPTSRTVCTTSSTTLSVTATGTAPLGYQWRKGGSNIAGATSSSFTINPITTGDAGSYDCVVSNVCGAVTSNSATLTVISAPTINSQPSSQTICVGGSATLTIGATGAAPLTFQWRKNGANISGANSTSFTINPAAAGDSGNYDCVVTNGCGGATSNIAALVVNAPINITSQPHNLAACQGAAAGFTVTATGGAPLAYQWRKGAVDIPGANASTLTINPATFGDAGSYDCRVSNACGSVTSDAAILTVSVGPGITSNPTEQTASVGGSATFTVTASGSGPLLYQWRKNAVNIGGATNISYTIDPVHLGDAANYSVLVSNLCGSAVSESAALRIVCGPCDTNCDGSVNQFDISGLVALLSPAPPPPCSRCAGDANGDGSVNAFDIQQFIDCLGAP